MSEAIPPAVRRTVVRIIQGFALGAAFGGLGACGTENTNGGPDGIRVSQTSTENTNGGSESIPVSPASTVTAQTSVNGQSGTEYEPGGGGDHPRCPCGFLTNPLRGTVLEVVNHIEGADFRPVRLGTVRLRVDQLLGSTTGLEIGSEITSPWFGDLPCFYGCASIAVGDEVLAFYRFPEPCIIRPGVECSNGDFPGSIALTPWADTVVLARLASGNFTLAVEDLPLLDGPQCSAQIGNVGDRLGPNDPDNACYERESPAP